MDLCTDLYFNLSLNLYILISHLEYNKHVREYTHGYY